MIGYIRLVLRRRRLIRDIGRIKRELYWLDQDSVIEDETKAKLRYSRLEDLLRLTSELNTIEQHLTL